MHVLMQAEAVLLFQFGFSEFGNHIGIPVFLGLIECLISPVENSIDGQVRGAELTGTNGYGDMLPLVIFCLEFVCPYQ